MDPTDQNVLNVFLLDTTDPQKVSNVQEAITAKFPDAVPPGGVVVVQGQYTITQLKSWYDDDLLPALGESEAVRNGWTLTDLEEDKNRLEVGVESADLIPQVKALVAQAGIPADVVRVTVRGPFRSFNSTSAGESVTQQAEGIGLYHQTIRDRFRPLFGGLQSEGDENGLCTYGFNAIRSGVRGFVVPSHCTDDYAEMESTEFYQPTERNSNRVGVETVDGSTYDCANPWEEDPCRKADAAFIRFDSGITGDMGHIARTTGSGSRVISHTNPRWRIVSEGSGAEINQPVVIVGRTTGTYTPIVIDVCINSPNADQNVVLECQDVATAVDLDRGDSGAPVFRITNSPQNGDVSLYGMMWGGDAEYDEIVYSPIYQIEASTELGSIRTCALEIGC